jgi:hypothetical protein
MSSSLGTVVVISHSLFDTFSPGYRPDPFGTEGSR